MRELIALMIAIGLGAQLFQAYLPGVLDSERRRIDQYSAAQFKIFTAAAQAHMSANFGPLMTATSGGALERVTASQLIRAGDLPANFRDLNTFNQRHTLLLRQDADDNLQGLALTIGGEAMAFQDTIRLAQQAGPLSGFIHLNTPTSIQGAGGAWQVPTANFQHPVAANRPAPGHLMALITTDASAALSPYLHRSAHPNGDANKMFTDLNMGGKTINTLKDARLADGNGGLIRHVSIHANNEIIDKPVCPAGLAAKIFVTPVQASDNGAGLPLIGFAAHAENANAKSWRVKLRVTTQNPAGTGEVSLEPDAAYGRVLVITRCS